MRKLLLIAVMISMSCCPLLAQMWLPIAYGGPPPGTVATPTVDNDTGSYASTVTVTASDATGGSTIYSCTNVGSDCTPSSTTTNPVTTTTTGTHICFSASKAGYTTSAVKCGTYTITAPSPGLVAGTATGAEGYSNGIGSATLTVNPTIQSGSDFLAVGVVLSNAGETCTITSVTSPHVAWTCPATMTAYIGMNGQICLGAITGGYTGSELITYTYNAPGPTCVAQMHYGEFVPTGTGVFDKTPSTPGSGGSAGGNSGTTPTLTHASEIAIGLICQDGVNAMTSTAPFVLVDSQTNSYSTTSQMTWDLTSATTGVQAAWTWSGGSFYTADVATVY
jgi:hypothetical protein